MQSPSQKQQDPGPLARLDDLKRDPETLRVIAQRVAGGETLVQIARAWEVPHGLLQLWLLEDETRMGLYRNALVAAGFTESDEAKEIADGVPRQAVDPEGKPLFDAAGKPVLVESDVARDKLRTEIRRWRASKNGAEFFGERLDVMHHRAMPSEEALLAQLDALIAGRPGLLDQLLERRAQLALPVNETTAGSPA